MSIAKIIGDRIRAYRNQKGWSQEYLAEKADVHHTYIGQLERSEKTPRLRAFQKSPERWVSLFPVSLKISASSSRKIISPHSAMLCCRNSL